MRAFGKPLQQPEFEEFLQQLLLYLFRPADHLCVADNPSGNHPRRTLQPTLEAAWTWLAVSQRTKTPNLLMGLSAFDDSGTYSELNCLYTQAMLLDMDYGELGHTKPSPFETYEDALGYLLTLPVRPTCAWHTGHGIQGFYKLSEPYLFPKGDGATVSLKRYKDLAFRLTSQMCMSDGTYTPAHLLRVPMTINAKPDIEPILGELLWFEPERTYSFEQLEQAVAGYGFEGLKKQAKQTKAEEDTIKLDLDPGPEPALDVPYEQLPEDLRDAIEAQHTETSDTLFRIVLRMLRANCSDATIHEAISHGPSFQAEKYRGKALKAHIDRCIEKIRGGKYTVYAKSAGAPIERKNVISPVPLSECAALPAGVEQKLGQYCKYAGIELRDDMRQSARFHEHLFTQHRSGVMETPCGFGKSTWALSHIAAHAKADNRYLYVVETVEAIYRAADMLENLTDAGVGRVHGFNSEACFKLCGVRHDWWECGATAKESVCRTCPAHAKCHYFNRAAEERKPILVMTHSGFIQQLERNTGLLDDSNVIIDEDLNSFIMQEFRHSDLVLLQQYASHVNPNLGAFFPHSTLAHVAELQKWRVPAGSDTFASRNYVFRDEKATAALSTLCESLRKAAGTGLNAPTVFGTKPGEQERAHDVLCQLLNVFRSTRANDATYAFKELYPKSGEDKGQLKYIVKKSRFNLAIERSWQKLWILNASAQLSPMPYPEHMPVYTCPELKSNSHLVRLHVVSANPMGTKLTTNLQAAAVIGALMPHLRRHQKIFVAVSKDGKGLEAVRETLKQGGVEPELVVRHRGRIKGINDARECTLAYLPALSLFTTIDDCALHAALILRRTYADIPAVFKEPDILNMARGRITMPAIREYYALTSLDQMYQAIWRTAVRDGKQVEAIVVAPEPEWLVALWKTVMPAFVLGDARKIVKPKPADIASYHEGTQAQYKAGQIDTDRLMALTNSPVVFFEADQVMQGLQIVNAPPGTEFKKTDVGGQFGYTGDQAWKANKKRILSLLSPFFEEGSTNRMLRRK